ncbi:MAG: polysaccharide deacetylase family protein [Lachnospiraceae bacterium]|nr:polysaccharide deacetylase family protein [Lachnospiraceae bacterium]
MKKLFSCILAFVLAAGLLSCMPESYTISDTGKTDAPVTQEPGSKDPGDPATLPVVTDPPTQEPVTQAPPEESTAPSKGAETSAPYSDPDQGVLKDLGIWPDAASLPNNSIPYGNDWEDRDQYGIANGIHWYEAKFGKYGAVYRINTTEKLLYLTMDEGYEAGHTPVILDILKEKNVKAVFFITKQFYDSDPELIQRMIDEGHILGNHTCAHPSGGYPKYVDAHGLQSFVDDVSRLHKLVYDSFGYKMKLFRFPEGESSEQLMAVLQNYGYTSVFWSYAHRDFVMDDQPDVSVTLERCKSHMGCGAVYLLHAVSSSNTAALADFIDAARAAGYEFGVFPVDEVAPAR